MNNQKIFILSTGRTGTTFLYKFFQDYYPEFKITHQTKWSRVFNIISNLPLKSTSKCLLLKFLFRLLKRRNFPDTTLDPLLSLSIAALLNEQTIENVKIIHLIRNPISFTQSFMRWKSSSPRKWTLHYIVPFWQPVPLFHGIKLKHWLNMLKYEKYLWIWNYKNDKFRHLANKYDYLSVRLEDLVQSANHGIWSRLLDFTGLPVKDIDYAKLIYQKPNMSKSENKTLLLDYSKLNSSCKKICGELATSFGYKM